MRLLNAWMIHRQNDTVTINEAGKIMKAEALGLTSNSVIATVHHVIPDPTQNHQLMNSQGAFILVVRSYVRLGNRRPHTYLESH